MRNPRERREDLEGPRREPVGRPESAAASREVPVRREWAVGAGDGAIGGILGGIAMGMVAMIVAAFIGKGFWAPMKLISATFYGQSAMQTAGFAMGPVLVGMMIHLGMSAVLGAVYGTLARAEWTAGAIIGWAVVFALAVWVLAELVILPLVNPVMSQNMAPILFGLYHVVFGAVLGWYLAARRS